MPRVLLALTLDQQYYLLAAIVLLLPGIPVALFVVARLRAQRRIPPDRRSPYVGPPVAPGNAIEETRRILGPPRDGRVPRVFERGRPSWMGRADPLKHVY